MSSRIVLDASAALRVLMGLGPADDILSVLHEAAVVLVPGLYVSEVANGLRGYVSAGALDRSGAIDRFEDALHLTDDVVDDRELGVEALSESIVRDHPAYDLVYAVLARRTAAAVLTRDRRLLSLLPELGVPSALDA